MSFPGRPKRLPVWEAMAAAFVLALVLLVLPLWLPVGLWIDRRGEG